MDRAEITVILLKATKRKDCLLFDSQGIWFSYCTVYIALKVDDSGIYCSSQIAMCSKSRLCSVHGETQTSVCLLVFFTTTFA